MTSIIHNGWAISTIFVLVGMLALLLFQIIYIRYAGVEVPTPDIPRGTQIIGSAGDTIHYVVLGDSTSIGQGTSYDNSIAYKTATYLAMKHVIHLTNVGISGARVADVLGIQVAQAVQLKPDVVLIAVGANDVTHFTSMSDLEKNLIRIIDRLQTANSAVHIVITGSPDMGSVPRFPWPTNSIAHLRTQQVNRSIARIAQEKMIVFAPIAQKTGAIFAQHPELFAIDKFHPNAQGYAVWVPIIIEALNN